ncbi:hypothetical protein [Haladaptatus cibarius]|uniref:hypothetical protein n=1 Tax=Haladaptatus cibarius TaxID=453847 RepID=UPI001184E91C|nr:hypothetical protein [Haladaptatus cibarius]
MATSGLLIDKRPAVLEYHAENISPDSASISETTMVTTAERKKSIVEVSSLSNQNQKIVAQAISDPNSSNSLTKSKKNRSQDLSFVMWDYTRYR